MFQKNTLNNDTSRAAKPQRGNRLEAENITDEERVRRVLEAKILAYGGKGVASYWGHPHALQLLTDGRLFSESVEMRPGNRYQCHVNVAKLWERASTKIRIGTGYALFGGTWILHSWCLKRDDTLLETTVRPDLYFGIVLERQEALKFWLFNLHIQRMHELYFDLDDIRAYWNTRKPVMRLLQEVHKLDFGGTTGSDLNDR